jgi:2-polyprenyl-3-methyl-5-hydroxy-6-metoxy-1,4-benzoquinol methylase
MQIAERFEANDLSAGAIEQAKAYAADAKLADRVTYTVANLNHDGLPSARYDAIFGISSVHHVTELESFFRQCCKALKPAGLLFLDEYIGPARFQSRAIVGPVDQRDFKSPAGSILPQRLYGW